jgi:S1-C subfamily serine protease
MKLNRLYTWIIAIAVVLFLFANYTQADDILSRDDATVIATIKSTLPNVVNLDQGSGFYIDSTHVITCWHVIEDTAFNGKVWIENYQGERIQGEIVSSNIDIDYAILKVPLNANVRALEPSNPEVGQGVIIIGNPFGILPFTATKGMVANLVRYGSKHHRNIQLDATLNHGNSGSIVMDLYGKVIGMAVAGTKEGLGIGFVIPIGDIK